MLAQQRLEVGGRQDQADGLVQRMSRVRHRDPEQQRQVPIDVSRAQDTDDHPAAGRPDAELHVSVADDADARLPCTGVTEDSFTAPEVQRRDPAGERDDVLGAQGRRRTAADAAGDPGGVPDLRLPWRQVRCVGAQQRRPSSEVHTRILASAEITAPDRQRRTSEGTMPTRIWMCSPRRGGADVVELALQQPPGAGVDVGVAQRAQPPR
ncbi:hypothetical protein [Modestobacter sp. KNN46-3]|jgi:hypothetical protein|uniref:hypothetical protein n=1 Tax=Modestobacter sp. KNN46-3 TaxID=2711218 RepID=UPI00240543E7|nr:hypothetical protein [Modestobacter sp. KNN46-3]